MPPEGLSFRRYEPSDFDQVWRLHKVALVDAGADAGEGPWEDDLRAIGDAYLASGGDFLVGEYLGRVVAMGALRRVGPADAVIARMRVHPDLQRRGIGRAMLELLETHVVDGRVQGGSPPDPKENTGLNERARTEGYRPKSCPPFQESSGSAVS